MVPNYIQTVMLGIQDDWESRVRLWSTVNTDYHGKATASVEINYKADILRIRFGMSRKSSFLQIKTVVKIIFIAAIVKKTQPQSTFAANQRFENKCMFCKSTHWSDKCEEILLQEKNFKNLIKDAFCVSSKVT